MGESFGEESKDSVLNYWDFVMALSTRMRANMQMDLEVLDGMLRPMSMFVII